MNRELKKLGEMFFNENISIVLCEWEGISDKKEYITWLVPEMDMDKKVSGHYFTNLKDALDDFYSRVKREYNIVDSICECESNIYRENCVSIDLYDNQLCVSYEGCACGSFDMEVDIKYCPRCGNKI